MFQHGYKTFGRWTTSLVYGGATDTIPTATSFKTFFFDVLPRRHSRLQPQPPVDRA